jgi:hypothetical protein
MADAYLVLFVADPANDDHAAALRDVARAVPGAGFFADPGGGPERTVGTYLKTADLAGGLPLIRAVAATSRALELRFEVQYAERILGFLESGRPDAALRAELGGLGDIPEPF